MRYGLIQMRCPSPLLAILLLTGCNVSSTAVLPSAEALWGDGATFCARSTRGLECWEADEHTISSTRLIEGLSGAVRAVAFGFGQICALDAEGVACDQILEKTAQRKPGLEGVTELTFVSGYQSIICALEQRGRVLCWQYPEHEPTILVSDGAAHLHRTTDGRMLCVETKEARLHCHEFQDGVTPHQTMTTTINPPLRRVSANTTGGEFHVIDAGGFRYGQGRSSIVVTGNPFAVADPLAVEATFRPVPHQVVSLNPVTLVANVRDLAAASIWTFVLDERGIRSIDLRRGTVEKAFSAQLPSALLAVDDGCAYARVGEKLFIQGFAGGGRVNKEVSGVVSPQQVVVGLYQACVRHADGVSCHDRID